MIASREKSYYGKLIIGEKIVSIDLNESFSILKIQYLGQINIRSYLPKGYKIIKKNNNFIFINNRRYSNRKITNLFSYKGTAIITKCFVFDVLKQRYSIPIDKRALELWSTLYGSTDNNTFVKYKWEDTTRNWENIEFNGKNNRRNKIHIVKSRQIDSADNQYNKITTITREIRKI